MSFDVECGSLRLADGLHLHRALRRDDLVHDGRYWEPWLHYRDQAVGYRWRWQPTRRREALVAIVLFWPDGGLLREWQLAPAQLSDGAQARRDGPRTRALRDWFLLHHGAALPCKRAWGEIDAFHDPRNLSSAILCSYSSA